MSWNIGDSRVFESNGLVLRVTKVEDIRYKNLSTQNISYKVTLQSPVNIKLVEINIFMFKELLDTIYKSVTQNLTSPRFAQVNIRLSELKKKYIR